MPTLLELQEAFGAAIEDADRDRTAVPVLRGTPKEGIARLAIYRGNVRENCVKALACAHPIVRKIVGDEFFEATAREFVAGHPSTTRDLALYGERFPRFLEDFPHTAGLPYLPDVARMEWLAHRAHFAADPRPLDIAALPGMPPERYTLIRPRLAPACGMLVSVWPLARIWTIHQDDYDGAFEIDLDAGPDRILVHRPRWRAQVASVGLGDFRFLQLAARGATLGEALEAAVDVDRDFDPSLALARWMREGVVVALGEDP